MKKFIYGVAVVATLAVGFMPAVSYAATITSAQLSAIVSAQNQEIKDLTALVNNVNRSQRQVSQVDRDAIYKILGDSNYVQVALYNGVTNKKALIAQDNIFASWRDLACTIATSRNDCTLSSKTAIVGPPLTTTGLQIAALSNNYLMLAHFMEELSLSTLAANYTTSAGLLSQIAGKAY